MKRRGLFYFLLNKKSGLSGSIGLPSAKLLYENDLFYHFLLDVFNEQVIVPGLKPEVVNGISALIDNAIKYIFSKPICQFHKK
jgi:hypothetical protein